MRKIIFVMCGLCMLGMSLQSCRNTKTYAELRDEEFKAIKRFIELQDIKVLTMKEFEMKDSTTDVSKNEYVQLSESGSYMQIIDEGEGDKLPDGRHEILSRYVEAMINNEGKLDTVSYNTLGSNAAYPDVYTVTKSGTDLSATFTSGIMMGSYSTAYVPTGWLYPLQYIKPGREMSKRARVRMIVVHTDGTSAASQQVYACYYEISYQLGR